MMTGAEHYDQALRLLAEAGRTPAATIGAVDPASFWSRVDRSGDCWLWLGYVRPDGYGQCYTRDGNRLAHRVAYVLDGRDLDPALTLDHLCRRRACVNPQHLEQVTAEVNTARGDAGVARASQQHAKTKCPAGHDYAGDNLIVVQRPNRAGPERRCRTCTRATERRSRARKTGV
ncbi:HNH endonuclease [Gordonia phage Lennon]|uniref:HNH endonuclease n=3 Tax=Vividuovirus TaxID=2560251 RepID=A0A2U9PFY1_9CAUD|nr:HNH endonuclease [Gordonia phage Lennon]YP_010097941.1 HNH endonuclease [Gordonia phage Angelicage]ATN90244.1 HNH endonuclease [Gordonia phage Lennon]AWT50549.1 HNH endonuclease [Gordonia phage Sitar]AXQ62754.1 HNH endonuclease [Gordonia phage Angelicage]